MWNFRDLDVWKRAVDLTKVIYSITNKFHHEEQYGLSGQLRRAAVSISSNIAEGCGRRTSKDCVGFLHNATGSVNEVESELLVAKELGYLKEIEIKDLISELKEIGKMLNGLIRNISDREIV